MAQKLYIKAFDYLTKSQNIVIDISGLEEWNIEIQRVMNIAINEKLNVNAFVKIAQVENILSQKPSLVKNLDYKLQDSWNFITKMQNKEGSWNEFFNEAGLSDVWATSFILSYLGNLCKDKKTKQIIRKATQFLLHSKNGQLWGYNKEWIPDADSSTFALQAIFAVNKTIDRDSLIKWYKYQNDDGGFSTYNNAKHVLSSLNWEKDSDVVQGWLTSHICVSTAAFYFLIQFNQQSNEFFLLKDYLKNKTNKQNLWGSYWWTSPIYATSFMIKSLPHIQDSELLSIVNKSIDALLKLQNKNGSFGDKYKSDSAFYTALVVDAFCQHKGQYAIAKKQIDQAVEWLLSNQLSDGSWASSATLRMPASYITLPESIKEWPEDTKGTNIRVLEFSRLFSTSVCISALTKYKYVSG